MSENGPALTVTVMMMPADGEIVVAAVVTLGGEAATARDETLFKDTKFFDTYASASAFASQLLKSIERMFAAHAKAMMH